MLAKVEYFSELAERSTAELTKSRENWTNFLNTAAKLYKYPFDEQLMIYAQRPDATACAPIETWNRPMNRFVRRGSKGIVLIDKTSARPKVKYVFDISDTEDGRRNSRRPFQWELRPEHEQPVIDALAESYGVPYNDIAALLYSIAGKLAAEYYGDNRRDIEYSAEGSFLGNLDDYNIGSSFCEALTMSTATASLHAAALTPPNM